MSEQELTREEKIKAALEALEALEAAPHLRRPPRVAVSKRELTRRPVQICVAGATSFSTGVYALADDGSIWWTNVTRGSWGHWCQLPPLPQPEAVTGEGLQ